MLSPNANECHGARTGTVANSVFAGALSKISMNAICPTAVAAIRYQAGAIALPVIWMSHVMTSCVVPPKSAMEVAYIMAKAPPRMRFGRLSVIAVWKATKLSEPTKPSAVGARCRNRRLSLRFRGQTCPQLARTHH